MDRDSLDFWLQSVAEAKKHQLFFLQSLWKITKYFKPKLKALPKCPAKVEVSFSTPSTMSAFLTSDSSSYISLDDFDDDSPALSSDLDPG